MPTFLEQLRCLRDPVSRADEFVRVRVEALHDLLHLLVELADARVILHFLDAAQRLVRVLHLETISGVMPAVGLGLDELLALQRSHLPGAQPEAHLQQHTGSQFVVDDRCRLVQLPELVDGDHALDSHRRRVLHRVALDGHHQPRPVGLAHRHSHGLVHVIQGPFCVVQRCRRQRLARRMRPRDVPRDADSRDRKTRIVHFDSTAMWLLRVAGAEVRATKLAMWSRSFSPFKTLRKFRNSSASEYIGIRAISQRRASFPISQETRFVIEFGFHLNIGIPMLVHFPLQSPRQSQHAKQNKKKENQTNEVTHPHLLMKFSRPK